MIRSVLVSLLMCGMQLSQNASPASTQNQSNPSARKSPSQAIMRYHPDPFAGRASVFYRRVWGIKSLSLKSAEAGEVIRFSYEVVDADKAKTLNDKKVEPSLIDQRAHVKLVVPMVDKARLMGQTSDPQAGKTYWMLFSNKGGYVKRGDRVSIVIGNFRAEGLVVD
jgi:hypothetical protein